MPKRRRRPHPEHVLRCQRCRTLRHDGEKFYAGYCDRCRDVRAAARRAATGARILSKARDAGKVERDGQTYHVLVLPPKRRTGRKIR